MEVREWKSEAVKALMEFSTDWFMWVNPAGVIQNISPGVIAVTGYNPEDFINNTSLLEEITYPQEQNKSFTSFFSTLLCEKIIISEFRIVHRNGTLHWIEQQVIPVFDSDRNISGRVIINRDITSAKTLQQKLFRVNQILEQSAEAIAITDIRGNIEYVNSAFEEITGFSFPEVKETRLPTFRHDDAEQSGELQKSIKEGTVWRGQNVFHRKDGHSLYLDSVIFPLKDQTGEIINYVKISRDITSLKKIEDDLRESEAKNTAILNLQPDIIFIQKRDGTYLDYFTRNGDELFVPPDKFLGQKMETIFPDDKVKNFLRHYEKAVATDNVEFFEYDLHSKDGVKYYEIRIVPFGEDKILSIIRNITEKKQQEKELLKYKKLESVGVLAGGIAHDFNNILSGTIGNIELASMDLTSETSAAIYLKRAKRGLLRATGLTQQLLTFARGGDPVIGLLDVKGVITETVLFNLSGSSVKPFFSLDENLWMVKADKGQLEQIFGNLTINAKQAMPEGGKFYIDAMNSPVPPEGLVKPLQGDQKFLKITLKDTGSGIPEKYREKIFDPYFSTKQTGSGLGLATVYSIVKRHGGLISVSSSLEIGTTFTLYLPAEVPSGKNHDEPEQNKKRLLKNLRILIMDDEEMIRTVVSSMLKKLGCSVDVTCEGAEAVKKYEDAMKAGIPYNVVVMDLTIPGGMGGKETIEKLKDINPGIKAIVTSGYSQDPVMAHYRDYGFSGCVIKPFTLEALRTSLIRIL